MRKVDPAAHAMVQCRILDAARSLFAAHGFHRASMNSVAHAAKLAKAALYHYFPSKKALLNALHEDMWGDAAQQLAAAPKMKNLREALMFAGRGYGEHFRDPRAAQMMQIAFNVCGDDPGLLEESTGLAMNQVEQNLIRFFQPYFPKNSTKQDIQRHVLPFFGALFHYLFVMSRTCTPQGLPGTYEEYLNHLVDVFAVLPRRTRGKQ